MTDDSNAFFFPSSKNPDDTELDDALQNVVSIRVHIHNHCTSGNINTSMACVYIPSYNHNQ